MFRRVHGFAGLQRYNLDYRAGWVCNEAGRQGGERIPKDQIGVRVQVLGLSFRLCAAKDANSV